jgi:hypothetical protein
MQIFLSYASEKRAVAESIAYALRDRGHEVFLDEDYLQAGKGYSAELEDAIRDSDLMIFLISPQSVEPGRYTLSELEFARRQWRGAGRRLLPVMIEPTDMTLVPAFAKAVNILRPVGNIAAEVAACANELRGREYAVMVGLKLSAIGLAIGLLSFFSFEPTGLARIHTPEVPFLGKVPAPEVGLIFGLPIGIAVWLWGLRRWWAPVIAVLLVAVCYWITAPEISRYTLQLNDVHKQDPRIASIEHVLEKNSQRLDAEDLKSIAEAKDLVAWYETASGWLIAGLKSGALLAFGTMLSLGLIMSQFRSIYRWLIVLVAGAVVSAIDAYIVLQAGGLTFSRLKATMLIIVWQVVFGALLGYWLARGKTTVAG